MEEQEERRQRGEAWQQLSYLDERLGDPNFVWESDEGTIAGLRNERDRLGEFVGVGEYGEGLTKQEIFGRGLRNAKVAIAKGLDPELAMAVHLDGMLPGWEEVGTDLFIRAEAAGTMADMEAGAEGEAAKPTPPAKEGEEEAGGGSVRERVLQDLTRFAPQEELSVKDWLARRQATLNSLHKDGWDPTSGMMVVMAEQKAGLIAGTPEAAQARLADLERIVTDAQQVAADAAFVMSVASALDEYGGSLEAGNFGEIVGRIQSLYTQAGHTMTADQLKDARQWLKDMAALEKEEARGAEAEGRKTRDEDRIQLQRDYLNVRRQELNLKRQREARLASEDKEKPKQYPGGMTAQARDMKAVNDYFVKRLYAPESYPEWAGTDRIDVNKGLAKRKAQAVLRPAQSAWDRLDEHEIDPGFPRPGSSGKKGEEKPTITQEQYQQLLQEHSDEEIRAVYNVKG
jgi:hypothetical protein